jgi:hypothetical protein
LAQIDKYFKMKPGSIMEPIFYLGAKLKKTVIPNGVVDWGMSSSKYVQAAVQKCARIPEGEWGQGVEEEGICSL